MSGSFSTTATIPISSIRLPAGSVTDEAIGSSADIQRSKLQQDSAAVYNLPLESWKVHDAMQTALPGTAAADDLAVITGTPGTDALTIQTSDADTTTITQRMSRSFCLPAEYDAGQSITLRIRGGMITNVSDTTATADVECWKHDDDGAVGSDICATAAQTINSLTKGDDDFTITPTGLAAGDVLTIRVTIAITDAGTGSAVIGELSKVSLLLDIRG